MLKCTWLHQELPLPVGAVVVLVNELASQVLGGFLEQHSLGSKATPRLGQILQLSAFCARTRREHTTLPREAVGNGLELLI